MKIRVLIIGGGGFVGSYLTKELINKNYDVSIIDNFKYDKSPLPQEMQNKIVDFRLKELLKGANIYRDEYLSFANNQTNDQTNNQINNQKFDIIINLATVPMESDDKEIIDRQIIGDTALNYRICRDLESFGCKKYIYLSSLFVYGDFEDYSSTEKTSINPRTAYGISKTIGEFLTKTFTKNWNIIRTTSVYGFGDVNNRVTQIIMNKILNSEDFWVNDVYLDFIYVKDLVEGIVKVIESNYTNEIFHISGGFARNLSNFAEIAMENISNSSKYDIRTIDDRPKRYTLDNTKARVLLQWEPRWSITEGIVDYVNYIRKYGFA